MIDLMAAYLHNAVNEVVTKEDEIRRKRQEAGRKGAAARHSKTPEQKRAISQKAARTRLLTNPAAFYAMAKKGAKMRHYKSIGEKQDIAQKATETRLKGNEEAFKQMGKKAAKIRERKEKLKTKKKIFKPFSFLKKRAPKVEKKPIPIM